MNYLIKNSQNLLFVIFLMVLSNAESFSQKDTTSVSNDSIRISIRPNDSIRISVRPNDSIRISIHSVDDSKNKVSDVIQSFGWIDYNAEYYTIDSENSFLEHHFVYQPYISKTRTIKIEIGFADAYLENGRFFTPTDLAISYQKIIRRKVKKPSGYQGVLLSMKFIIPTGRDEYYSGFDSWTLEPKIATQWKLNNPNWAFSGIAKFNYSIGALPEKDRRFSFLRVENYFGYENKKWWGLLKSDYRYITDSSDSTFYIGVDTGYKVSSRLAIRIGGKKRIYGDNFYDSLFSLGGVWYL